MYPVLVLLIVHRHHSITDTVMARTEHGHSIAELSPGTHLSFVCRSKDLARSGEETSVIMSSTSNRDGVGGQRR